VRDEYVGDIGDFGKYILLKELSAHDGIRLGVNWYYNMRPEGAHAYLSSSNKDEFRRLDRELFGQMQDVVHPYKRTVRQIEQSGILPNATLYYREPIPSSATKPAIREKERMGWFEDSLKALAGADVVFLDPDNGIPYPRQDNSNIEVPRIGKGNRDAVRYAYADEIKTYYDRGKSVIVYSHRDMKPEHVYLNKISLLRAYVSPSDGKILILRFKRFSIRDYLIIPQNNRLILMNQLVEKLTGPFGFLFDHLRWRDF